MSHTGSWTLLNRWNESLDIQKLGTETPVLVCPTLRAPCSRHTPSQTF